MAGRSEVVCNETAIRWVKFDEQGVCVVGACVFRSETVRQGLTDLQVWQ